MPMASMGYDMTELLRHSYSHMTDIYFELREAGIFFNKYLKSHFVRHSNTHTPTAKTRQSLLYKEW